MKEDLINLINRKNTLIGLITEEIIDGAYITCTHYGFPQNFIDLLNELDDNLESKNRKIVKYYYVRS